MRFQYNSFLFWKDSYFCLSVKKMWLEPLSKKNYCNQELSVFFEQEKLQLKCFKILVYIIVIPQKCLENISEGPHTNLCGRRKLQKCAKKLHASVGSFNWGAIPFRRLRHKFFSWSDACLEVFYSVVITFVCIHYFSNFLYLGAKIMAISNASR